MDNLSLQSKVEAILFFKGEPVKINWLAKTLGVSDGEITNAVSALKTDLEGRGVRLVINEDRVTLVTAPEMSELIESMTKEELLKDLGKAGLETLSIVLYRGPVSRRDIDYVRGVNSTFILRNLLIRGLVERVQDKDNQRVFMYKPTFELLSYLGVSDINELPEYGEIVKELEEAESSEEKE